VISLENINKYMYNMEVHAMTKLEYTFKNDTLFKALFVRYPELLKQLVADLLRIDIKSIEQFAITNPEITPDVIGDKLCRLDINMTVNGQKVDIELQVRNEGDYPERTLYYWAREYSSALGEGKQYTDLPKTVAISILYFKLFDCEEYYSEFQALEVTRHTQLTDHFQLMYFELPKFTKTITKDDNLKTWLSLFKSETEEDLREIESMGVSVMKETVEAYRKVTAADEFRNIERMRFDASNIEASAIGNAERKRDAHWQGVVADVVAEKDAALAENEKLRQQIAALQASQNS